MERESEKKKVIIKETKIIYTKQMFQDHNKQSE